MGSAVPHVKAAKLLGGVWILKLCSGRVEPTERRYESGVLLGDNWARLAAATAAKGCVWF